MRAMSVCFEYSLICLALKVSSIVSFCIIFCIGSKSYYSFSSLAFVKELKNYCGRISFLLLTTNSDLKSVFNTIVGTVWKILIVGVAASVL